MITITCSNKTFKNIRAVIFDKDGTLEDSHSFLRELAQRRSRLVDAQIPGIGEPLLMAFGVMDATLDPKGLMAVGSRRENEIAMAAYIAETGRSWSESLEIARKAVIEADRHLKRTPETVPLCAGGLEILQQFSAAGLKLGILSSDSTEGVKNFIERHHLSSYFQLTMGVQPDGLMKPDPQLFQDACAALGVEPAETLMVGDSSLDMQMAQGGGAAGAIGICWDGGVLKESDCAIARLLELHII
ncbi:HAD family hydrolase [Lusitaniella coriacea LEGE 07157]|uniref:HAD family hydrolase n=1 Tax=Lusitaniella coriacea LEGE 07157 TaxID=945747 RepID=A0A8J7DVM0_9CYAN|nr:HAD family hydrolase [Lusitaniella coriacea]MBE9115838.1 HAD family hydrolase [Lusitaniella coriacea LEGE 07157]